MATGNGRELAGVAQAILLDDPDFLRGIVERTLQAMLEEQMTAHRPEGARAARSERGDGRTGDRNGDKPRALTTRVGTIALRVPGALWAHRDGTFSTELFARY